MSTDSEVRTEPSDGSSWPSSVAVIGAAGLVGSGVVRELAVGDGADVVHLVDVHENLVRAQLIDITEAQVLAGAGRATLSAHGTDNLDGVGPVDLVVLAASAPEVPGGDRHAFLARNRELILTLRPTLERLVGENGLVLMLSNPVDVLADVLRHTSDIGADQILGYSVNDSLRLRIAIARELGVPPLTVDAWTLGEHGNGQVPLFSRVLVEGLPVALDTGARQRIIDDVDGWFDRWSALQPGRSSGWTTALGVAGTIRDLGRGETVPAAVWSGSVDGLADTFIALPVHLVDGRPTPELFAVTDDERAKLSQAARSVQALTATTLGVDR